MRAKCGRSLMACRKKGLQTDRHTPRETTALYSMVYFALLTNLYRYALINVMLKNMYILYLVVENCIDVYHGKSYIIISQDVCGRYLP